MASFERFTSNDVTTASSVHTSDATAGSNADIIIGCNVANVGASTATVNVYITTGGNDVHLVKAHKIPVGSSTEIIQGKVILENGDVLKVSSDIAVDVYVSTLDSATA